MVKRLMLFLLLPLALTIGVGGCGLPRRDTMSVELSWGWGDVDLGIVEPNGQEYWVMTGPSYTPSGRFSPDDLDGGLESWTMSYGHYIGDYTPLVWSNPSGGYTGDITLTVTVNGTTAYATVPIIPGETLTFMNWHITREGDGSVLRYDLKRSMENARKK
ncbi:MAG: hypothetical protein ACM3XS_02005 [Bacteroidota bacterium]